jgi:hypothetical protein
MLDKYASNEVEKKGGGRMNATAMTGANFGSHALLPILHSSLGCHLQLQNSTPDTIRKTVTVENSQRRGARVSY